MSFVVAFAICVRASAKAVSFDAFVTLVITIVAVPVAAPPNALACALSRRRRSTFAWRYMICHAAHVLMLSADVPILVWPPGSGGMQTLVHALWPVLGRLTSVDLHGIAFLWLFQALG